MTNDLKAWREKKNAAWRVKGRGENQRTANPQEHNCCPAQEIVILRLHCLISTIMNDIISKELLRKKLKKFFITSILGNFIGYVAATFVTTFSTYHSYERRALKNLFGILPREQVEVHLIPEWLEWTVAVLLGFIVMELVNYFINNVLLRKTES